MDIAIQSIDESLLKPIPTGELGFGSVFSNRMFMQRFTEERGWHDATIKIYQPFSLDPATAVFHYAQEIFEGTKAYRRADGDINLFRPEENMRRFNNSAERMAMPMIDEDEHLEALIKLVELEQAWVPAIPNAALYLRPGMFATDAALGVYRSKSYLHFIILSPVEIFKKCLSIEPCGCNGIFCRVHVVDINIIINIIIIIKNLINFQ